MSCVDPFPGPSGGSRATVVVCFLALAFLLAATLGTPEAMAAQVAMTPGSDAQSELVPGQYIVVLQPEVANPRAVANDMAATHGLRVRHVYSHALKGFSAKIPDQVLEFVLADSRVAYVEQDRTVHLVVQTLPEGVDRIDADQSGVASPVDVDIAIIDTGIDLDHPDLNAVDGTNCIDVGSSSEDDNGHGTHVAGTVAAIDNDSHVVGVAPGAPVWGVKVLNSSGSGTWSTVICGIEFVTANATEFEVANMSLGGQGVMDSVRTAIQNSVAAGIYYAVAAGNDSQDVYGNDGVFETSDDFIPAAYPEVATVSAMADFDGTAGGDAGRVLFIGCGWIDDDTFADCFSNFSTNVVLDNPVVSQGAAIDLAAPGVSVLSTTNDGGTGRKSGTSMASPHVAGAAALYVAQCGAASTAQGVADIRQALIDAGQVQPDWRGGADTLDPDSNPEPLVFVADLSCSSSDPLKDIAVTSVSAPSSTVQGDLVSVDVTVENVGNQDVTADINVTLRDDTEGEDIGTQTISAGLDAGASTTLTYSWDTSGATIGEHTLTASHDVSDDDSSNDSLSTFVTVESAKTDIAVTSVSAPSSVTEGDVASIDVTVENVGNQDVTADINVTLRDDTAGVDIDTQTILDGLAAGGSTTLTYSWDTSGASAGDHTLTATQAFADDDATNDSASATVTVNEPSAGVSVTGIDPDTMVAGTSEDVTITGSGFVDGANVAFENGSGPAPEASNIVVVDDGTITATIIAKSGGPPRDRIWDVRVTNPDNSSGVLEGGLTITP